MAAGRDISSDYHSSFTHPAPAFLHPIMKISRGNIKEQNRDNRNYITVILLIVIFMTAIFQIMIITA